MAPSISIFILVVLNFILPEIADDFYHKILLYPLENGIFTYYLIFIIILSQFIFIFFGKIIIKRAYQNFAEFRSVSMDTLVSIGSLSALLMGYFLLVLYKIEENQPTSSNSD